MEYEINKLPKPDLIIFLITEPEVGQQLVLEKGHREYMKGIAQDIHERDIGFQKKVKEIYMELSKKDSWITINCMHNSKLKSREEIAEEVYEKVKFILYTKSIK